LEVIGKPFAWILYAVGLTETKSKAGKLIESGGAYYVGEGGRAVKINPGTVVDVTHVTVGEGEKKYLALRAGKWKTRTIEIT